MSLGAAAQGGLMPLGRERSDWPTEVVVDVPEGSVRPKKPGCSDRAHEGYSPVTSCFAVDVEPLLARYGDHGANSIRDVPRKVHVSRPTICRSAAGGRLRPPDCNARLSGIFARSHLLELQHLVFGELGENAAICSGAVHNRK